MPKSVEYKMTLYPAIREGGFISTKFEMLKNYPEKYVTAAGMPDLLSKVTAFAKDHGEGCQASVRCLAARKPPGFKDTTTSLYFNLDEHQTAVASAA